MFRTLSKKSVQFPIFTFNTRLTHPDTLTSKTFVQTSLFCQEVPFSPPTEPMPALFNSTATWSMVSNIKSRLQSKTDLSPQFVHPVLELHYFVQLADIGRNDQNVSFSSDPNNSLGGFLQSLLINVDDSDFEAQSELNPKIPDKHIGDSNEVINVPGQFYSSSLPNPTSSACNQSNPPFVENGVNLTIHRRRSVIEFV